jgi:glycosyltransferase involved in cell wall biosynthesis
VLSRTEAQPRVILEAMLMGVVVAVPADTAGFGLVADGRTGVFVEVDNGRDVLDAIAALVADPARMISIRREAAAFAKMQQQRSRLRWLSLLSAAGSRADFSAGLPG